LISIYSHTAKGEKEDKKKSDKWGEVVDVQNIRKNKEKLISQKNEYNYSREVLKKGGHEWHRKLYTEKEKQDTKYNVDTHCTIETSSQRARQETEQRIEKKKNKKLNWKIEVRVCV